MRATDPIGVYLQELSRSLDGSPFRRRRILAEVRTHLQDAVDADVEANGEAAAAEKRAIARFGTVEQTAAAFRREQSARAGSGRARLVVAGAGALGAGIVVLVLALTAGQNTHGSGAAGGHGGRFQAGVLAATSRLPAGGILVAAGASPRNVQYRLAGPGCVPRPARSRRLQLGLDDGPGACISISAPDLPPRLFAEWCDGRLGIHIGALSARAQTVRIVLADGLVIAAPVSRLIGPAAPGTGGVVLFAVSPTAQTLRVEILAANGRILSSVSGRAVAARLSGIAALLPPQLVVAGALTGHGPMVISLRRIDTVAAACARCPRAAGSRRAKRPPAHDQRGCVSNAERAALLGPPA